MHSSLSRYVILWHDGVREAHFDLMFETTPGSDLATWRSPRWPIESPTPAVRLKDHRRAYLDYEGDLSAYRGRVTRVVGGTCEVVIGEGAVWDVRLLTGSCPRQFRISRVEGDHWNIEPTP